MEERSVLKKAKGNALFLILIAVALFATLSYAVTQSSRGGRSIAAEQAMLDQAVLENCIANVDTAITRVKIVNNCADSEISYETSAGVNPNPSAPVDRSCHLFDNTYGGGAYECGPYLDFNCTPAVVNPGDACGSLVYAGDYGGEQLLTTTADLPVSRFKYTGGGVTGATSTSDGVANTDILVGFGADYDAAKNCRALGPDWYLPSRDELLAVMVNRVAVGGFSALGTGGQYWTSTEANSSSVYTVSHQTGASSIQSKNSGWNLRCVRKAP